MRANYTLPSRLRVQPIYVSQTEEDDLVVQDRLWAIVAQVYDQSDVHGRIDVDVLQAIFWGLHYNMQTVDELGRHKHRRTMVERKEETKKEQKEQREYDDLMQKWDCVEWGKEQVEQWRH